jgi:release factor glutamine methyltransferase
MTLQEAGQQLIQKLTTIYDSREVASIADWVLEHLTGWKKSERIINKQHVLEPNKELLLERYTQELLQHKPVQYVLHESWFCGMKLYVDENVLIPRPETEELVEWIASEFKGGKIVDIGTGSGCIAIALKKKLPQSDVTACDVSEHALKVAGKNSSASNTKITLVQADILDSQTWPLLPWPDVLVSNPPYIPQQDKHLMSDNVLQYEPHIALFVQDNDPLIFYRTIAEFAIKNLLPGGAIYVEIHEDLGDSVKEIFRTNGFTHTDMRKDMQGKDRMVKAWKA